MCQTHGLSPVLTSGSSHAVPHRCTSTVECARFTLQRDRSKSGLATKYETAVRACCQAEPTWADRHHCATHALLLVPEMT